MSTTNAAAPTAPNFTISRTRTSIVSRARRTSAGTDVTGTAPVRRSRASAWQRSVWARREGQRMPSAAGRRGQVGCGTVGAAGERPARHPGGFPLVGVVGAGQLARMMRRPRSALGSGCGCSARTRTTAPPASWARHLSGSHTDLAALRRLGHDCDVVTFDHEHVPPQHLRALETEGVAVRPGPAALVHAQDKIVMRRRLGELGVPCPRVGRGRGTRRRCGVRRRGSAGRWS